MIIALLWMLLVLGLAVMVFVVVRPRRGQDERTITMNWYNGS